MQLNVWFLDAARLRDVTNSERKQFGQPIAEFQLIQAMLADSKAEIYAAKCMVLDAARLRDAGQNVSTEASCCKNVCNRNVPRC